ncbi:lantibiotic dehydratase C-terminal domain-containing protein [Arthrobacter sp. NPDC097144]|uniref:lantibiotic dehydratase C-terminal domain-containing protein n=1 Tax=Arthrobacter sp. NPDC097144 TaxID=3363946 RepID=UPI0038146B72
MTQVTAVRNASRTRSTAQWWTLSFYTGGFDVADGIIGELVTPLAAQAQAQGVQRWYYTRCMEPANAHVRLRILGEPGTIERLQCLLAALREQASGVIGHLEMTQQFSEPAVDRMGPGGAEPQNQRLEADLAKYGGFEGLTLAEEIFELSSELGAWAAARFPKVQNKWAFGSLLLFDSARSMMKGPRSASWPDRRRVSWDYYWDSHLRSCTAGFGPRAASVRQAMTIQVAAKVAPTHRLMAATAAENAVENWRRRWFRTIDSYLYRADKARLSRSAQHLTVYQAHMLLNRIGLSLREEAALGLYARSWSTEREAALLDR